MAIDSALRSLIDVMLKRNASDLILTVGQPPIIRVVGDLVPLEGKPLTPEEARRFANTLMTEEQQKTYEKTLEMDTSFGLEDQARFRVNIFQQRGSTGVAIP